MGDVHVQLNLPAVKAAVSENIGDVYAIGRYLRVQGLLQALETPMIVEHWAFIYSSRYVYYKRLLVGIWLKNQDVLELYNQVLVQDCSISSALALEILQSCTKPLIWTVIYWTFCSGRNISMA